MDPLTPWWWLYRIFGGLILFPALVKPVLSSRFGGFWADRLGFNLCAGSRPVWIHGASVGESKSALILLEALRREGFNGPSVISAATPSGLRLLGSKFDRNLDLNKVMAPPLDFWGAPARFLERMAPSCLIVIETEIWPELWHQCIKRSIPIFLISARVSPKAYQRYLRVRFFLASVLGGLTFLAANSHQDLERLISLGAPPERSEVLGSPKFDLLIEKAKNNLEALNKGVSFKTIFFNDLIDDNLNNDPDFLVKLNKLFASQVDSRPLILAGSTHQEEEKLIIETIKALSPRQFRLVIAPRHLQRVSEVALLAYKLNLRASLLSEVLDRKDPWAQRDTLIIDRLGLLTALYARCDIAIVGGSFFSGEGHNPIEPALWGRPIIFGPHTSSFEEIAEGLVTAGAALRSSPEGLREALLEFLDTPERAFKATSAGLKFVSNLRPIAPLLAKAVLLRLNKGS